MIRACIFDLDGVIVDTARYHFLAWKRLANELGYDLTEEDNERLKGVSRMQSLEIVLKLARISLNDAQKKEVLAGKKNTWFMEYVARMTPDEVFPGVRALIRDLRSHGIKVGLASSSKNAKKVIQLLHMQNEFDAIIDGSMITHAKPHPEIFLRAAVALKEDAKACIVLEDAEAGIEAALAAGMKCVGVGSPARLSKADKVVPQTSDFSLTMLRELEMVDK